MIEFTKSYKTGDGLVFGSIEEAQAHEIAALMKANDLGPNGAEAVAQFLIAQKDAVIDILTMTPNSKPKARKMHGGTKNRKKVITDAERNAVLAQANASDLNSGTHDS